MIRITFLLLFSFILWGCDSPMNNRVRDGKRENNLSTEKMSFSKNDIKAEVKWIAGPFGNISKTNHIMVLLYKDGKLFSLPGNQTLEFYATMPSMGHPLEDPGFFEEVDTGLYMNRSIRYNMPGDWKNELWIMDSEFNTLDKLEWLIEF